MRFTAEEALDFQGTDDAIFLDDAAATAICEEHDASFQDFLTEANHFAGGQYDAGDLLAWLGY
jgi:hypothetical protein